MRSTHPHSKIRTAPALLVALAALCAAPAPAGAQTALAPYDRQTGVPSNLLPARAAFSETFRRDVVASLPEGKRLETTHPEFLADAAERNLRFVATAKVKISFVHEGAGYLNVAGVFRYPTAKPPQSAAEAARLAVFPNASFSGSGGGLVMGDTVDLGTFQAGESLGFFVNANGFRPGQGITAGQWTVFSIDDLNGGASADLRRQTVLLRDPDSGRFVIGFEDIQRQSGGCDHDFNDVMLCVEATPESAVAASAVSVLVDANDPDGDGVPVGLDEFPLDPARAFTAESPAAGVDGVLAYEDLWPSVGDFDFNDLVVGWHAAEVRSPQGEIVDLEWRTRLLAVGAASRNGLSLRLPVERSRVARLTRALDGGAAQVLAPVAGEAQATVDVFDDASALLPAPAGYSYANTVAGSPPVPARTVVVRFTFSPPLPAGALGAAPYDAYLRSGRKEVHLPGRLPSDRMDRSLLGTADDATDLAQGFTFRTAKGLPFALSVPAGWLHPSERSPIDAGYLDFVPWALSAGAAGADWYARPAASRVIWRAP